LRRRHRSALTTADALAIEDSPSSSGNREHWVSLPAQTSSSTDRRLLVQVDRPLLLCERGLIGTAMIGQTLGHYRIDSKLGEGGMGVVYRAFDTHPDRAVAIKVLRPDATPSAERKRRFVQE